MSVDFFIILGILFFSFFLVMSRLYLLDWKPGREFPRTTGLKRWISMVNIFPAWDCIHAISFLGFNEVGKFGRSKTEQVQAQHARGGRLPNSARICGSKLPKLNGISIFRFLNVVTP